MDANGLKFWMLSSREHWATEAGALDYDNGCLRLSRHRAAPDWPAAESEAIASLDRPRGSIDRFGTRAFWSASDGKVMASGAVPGNVPIYTPALGENVTDVAIGYDDLLYVAVAGRIVIVDPRQRFDAFDVPALSGFSAWRIAAHPDGGIWAIDPASRKLARLRGRPSTIRRRPPYSAATFRPSIENPDPPRLIVVESASWDDDEHVVAIASNAQSQLAALMWKTDDFARVRLLAGDDTFAPAVALQGARTPFSIAWSSPNQIALLMPNADVNEAAVYTLDDGSETIAPDGDVYPLAEHDGGPFLHAVTYPANYPTANGSMGLYRLSLPSYTRSGSAHSALQLDSGRIATTWHRLYVEATIPDHCGIVVWLAAVDDPDAKPPQWYPHRFGAAFDTDAVTPRGAWVPAASEVPFDRGKCGCPPQRDRSGLFTVLIQRAGKRVRALRGRYLKVSVEILGNGLATPELAAIRAYASRFSYADKYLPELYREDLFGAGADLDGSATPADFLERFLDNFEGVLTPLEDKVAASYLLTNPDVTPPAALDWLGSWIGVAFDTGYGEDQRRELIRATPEMYRRRGTLRGLGLALDIASGGKVARGQIVILENYRLRRTFATILGADLSDTGDPLLAGISSTGNSFVGDTLFLGDEHRKEFLALFSDSLPKSQSERAAVEAFFDGLAYRVTILVHQEIEPQDLAMIRRVVALETPAHVSVRIEAASNAFRAGVASLAGVDTYLAPKPAPATARVDVSYLGRGDLIQRAPSLDPRLGGEDVGMKRPDAEAAAPPSIAIGNSFEIHADASKAFEGRKIVKYIWTRLD